MENNQLLRLLEELEEAAESVLSTRREVVDLDRRRNSNREAIRALEKMAAAHYKGDESKSWIAMGNMFIKLPNRQSREMLTKDQKELDITVNLLRSSLKDKVNSLREKEGREELKGFGLKALSREELSMVQQTIKDNIPTKALFSVR